MNDITLSFKKGTKKLPKPILDSFEKAMREIDKNVKVDREKSCLIQEVHKEKTVSYTIFLELEK